MASIATGSKTIPQVGETFVGDDPAVVKVIKITCGYDCGDVTGIETQAAHAILNIPANTIVEKAAEYVVTAWTAASTIAIGDCDSAAQFIAAASSTTAAAWKLGVDTVNVSMQYYDTPSALKLTVASADPVVGKSDVFIWYNFAGQNVSYA